eukprot:GHVN01063337.1.p1 GENE.GHVN01063337.1~~GHVN01063337.1.p1  ORF type:complete len:141 (-),score=29.88 GHVN01063337.1:118-492(-)
MQSQPPPMQSQQPSYQMPQSQRQVSPMQQQQMHPTQQQSHQPPVTAIQGQPPAPSEGDTGGLDLNSIPGWNEFFADGEANGIPVMKILTDPSMLEDQNLQTRFDELMQRHQRVKDFCGSFSFRT